MSSFGLLSKFKLSFGILYPIEQYVLLEILKTFTKTFLIKASVQIFYQLRLMNNLQCLRTEACREAI